MPRRAALLVAAAALCACRGGKGQEEKAPEPPSEHGSKVRHSPEHGPPPAGRVSWGPEAVSDPERNADGLSASLGVGQAALLWIEEREPGSDVFFARIAGEQVDGPVAVTSGASAYPPTAIEWTGREFALAWGDDRYRHVEVFIARVAYNGKVALNPRRFTRTESEEEGSMGVFSADSSQNPALGYYGGQLLTVWGGPGNAGRQQVYYTTVSKTGLPDFDPAALTSGITDAIGMRVLSYEEGALVSYCVKGAAGSDMYRLHLTGSPPQPVQPMKVATSSYIPCSIDHSLAGEGSMVFWAHRQEDEGGAVEDRLMGQLVAPDGTFVGESFELPGVRLVKFPGKHHAPFDALHVEGTGVAVAWVQREHDGSASLSVGLFDASGSPVRSPFVVETQADPTDPHLVPGGQPMTWVLAWLDRPLGGKHRRVYVAGLALE